MDRDPGGQQRASLRASDADREQFVEALRQHHVEGRLTVEELSDRSQQAYAARTLGDLDALVTDLPPLRPPAAAPGAGLGAGPPVRPGPGAPPPSPARRREAARAAFLRQALAFGLIALFLIAIWALTSPGYFWPVWPILGFGIALGWQAFNAFGPSPPDR
jgi:hypothetical protein